MPRHDGRQRGLRNAGILGYSVNAQIIGRMNSSSRSFPGCAGKSFFIISMIIYNLNFARVPVPPLKTDSPLVVNADAVLPLAPPLEV